MRSDARRDQERLYDRKRRLESETRPLYKTKRWQAIRRATFKKNPSCVMHLAETGERIPSTVCDHVTPHRGDVVKFWRGPFQGLCVDCHNRKKQREEHEGFSRLIDPATGWPMDDRHPFNAADKVAKQHPFSVFREAQEAGRKGSQDGS